MRILTRCLSEPGGYCLVFTLGDWCQRGEGQVQALVPPGRREVDRGFQADGRAVDVDDRALAPLGVLDRLPDLPTAKDLP